MSADAGETRKGSAMRVLIIEDEEALAAAVARGLRLQGMAVDVALDGRSGLDKACLNDYDVVILDRNLPEMHGDEVCRRLAGSGSTAGADSGAAGAVAGASFGSPITASTAPTGAVSSTSTLISRSTPATGDGISVSTLSVETSRRGSSAATVSPTFLSQRETVPSETDSPRAGRVTLVDIVGNLLTQVLYGRRRPA